MQDSQYYSIRFY